jgi:hypothetical protein
MHRFILYAAGHVIGAFELRQSVRRIDEEGVIANLRELLNGLRLSDAYITELSPHHLLLMIGSCSVPVSERRTPAQLVSEGHSWVPLHVVSELMNDEAPISEALVQ